MRYASSRHPVFSASPKRTFCSVLLMHRCKDISGRDEIRQGLAVAEGAGERRSSMKSSIRTAIRRYLLKHAAFLCCEVQAGGIHHGSNDRIRDLHLYLLDSVRDH